MDWAVLSGTPFRITGSGSVRPVHPCGVPSFAALYESWSVPFAVILVVPSVCSARSAREHADAFQRRVLVVGLLATISLSAKNAILIVEFAKELHDKGGDLIEATIEASRMRLCPILMTLLASCSASCPSPSARAPVPAARTPSARASWAARSRRRLPGIFYIPVFFVVVTSVFSFRWKWKKPKRRRTANIVETIPGDSHK